MLGWIGRVGRLKGNVVQTETKQSPGKVNKTEGTGIEGIKNTREKKDEEGSQRRLWSKSRKRIVVAR